MTNLKPHHPIALYGVLTVIAYAYILDRYEFVILNIINLLGIIYIELYERKHK